LFTGATPRGWHSGVVPNPVRGSFFYHAANADPNVIQADDNDTPFGAETFDHEAARTRSRQGSSTASDSSRPRQRERSMCRYC
jgi:hypothetical protein